MVQSASRLDGLTNLLTGHGVPGRDSVLSSRPSQYEQILPSEWISVYYRTNWACRKIVDTPPDFMTREWGQYTLGGDASSDETEEINEFLKRLKLAHKFRAAQRLANLRGNCALILFVDDGERDLSKPINWKQLKSLKSISKPISNRKIHPEYSFNVWDLEEDEKPKMFEVQLAYGSSLVDANGEKMELSNKIHSDRVLWFRGAELDEDTRNDSYNNEYWGCDDSILQNVIPVINRYVRGFDAASEAVARMNHKMYGTTGLLERMLADPDNTERYYKQRISSNEVGESIYNTTIYDKEQEKYDFLSPTVGGVEGILKSLREELIAASGLAPSVLYQIFSSGIDAAGKTHSEKQTINADMRSLQEKKFRKPLEDLLKVVHLSKDGPTKGEEPEQWSWVWKDLQPPSDGDKAGLRAQYAGIVSQVNAVNPDVANKMIESHWGGAEFNPEVTIDFEEMKREAEEKAAAEQEQQMMMAEQSEEFAPDEEFDPFAEGGAEEPATDEGLPPEEEAPTDEGGFSPDELTEDDQQFDSAIAPTRFRQAFRLDADAVLKLDGKRDRKQIAYGLLITPEKQWTARQRMDAKRIAAYMKATGRDGGDWVRGE